MLRDSRDIIRRLITDGFVLISVRGSHHKYRHPDDNRVVIVTHPRKDIPSGTLRSIYAQARGRRTETMAHYIALIHKQPDSGYGISFPDVPGVTTVADTLDDAMREAGIVLGFAFKDRAGERPVPRSLDALRQDPDFVAQSADAVVAAIAPTPAMFDAA